MRSAAFLDTEPNWLRKPSDADEAGRGKSNLEVVSDGPMENYLNEFSTKKQLRVATKLRQRGFVAFPRADQRPIMRRKRRAPLSSSAIP